MAIRFPMSHSTHFGWAIHPFALPFSEFGRTMVFYLQTRPYQSYIVYPERHQGCPCSPKPTQLH